MANGLKNGKTIAAEMALVYLRGIEPQVEHDPELLLSNETVLSLAAIRHEDPIVWYRWRDILQRHGKLDVIRHILGEAVRFNEDGCESDVDRLIRLILETGVEFFHDPLRRGWCSVRHDGHWENHLIRSRSFQYFLRETYYRNTGESPGTQSLRIVQEQFDANAMFGGAEQAINLRVANCNGRIYFDLCDPGWRAVEIDCAGWRIIDRPPVKFCRPRGSQALPEPARGGTLDLLRPFLNVDDQGWVLTAAFLVAALRPGFPCPILVVKGGQGTGKSTTCKIISALIDPRTAALRGVPRDVRDLIAAASNSWLVCFDNLSQLSDELADAACRLSTGGGFGGRELYSDSDQAIFDAIRPLVLNAIPDLGCARPDFLDRSLVVELQDVAHERRRDEMLLWQEFEAKRARIIGALLDAVVIGLRNLPEVALDSLPRMADFARWATACEEGMGMRGGEFLCAYRENLDGVRALALDSLPFFEPLVEVASEGFTGTASELLDRLRSSASESARRSGRWPKAPNILSNVLRRVIGNLRSIGIQIEFSRRLHGGARVLSVHRSEGAPEAASPSSPSSPT